jgi:hypothetical protein
MEPILTRNYGTFKLLILFGFVCVPELVNCDTLCDAVGAHISRWVGAGKLLSRHNV